MLDHRSVYQKSQALAHYLSGALVYEGWCTCIAPFGNQRSYHVSLKPFCQQQPQYAQGNIHQYFVGFCSRLRLLFIGVSVKFANINMQARRSNYNYSFTHYHSTNTFEMACMLLVDNGPMANQHQNRLVSSHLSIHHFYEQWDSPITTRQNTTTSHSDAGSCKKPLTFES